MMILRAFLKHPQLLHGATCWDATKKAYVQTGPLLKEVGDLVRQAHVFVIDDDATLDRPGFNSPGTLPEGWEERPMLAPPFPVCWFEVACSNNPGALPLRFYGDETLVRRVDMSGAIGALMREKAPGVCDLFVMEVYGKRTRAIELLAPGEKAMLTGVGCSIVVYRDVDSYRNPAEGAPAFRTLPASPPIQVANHWLHMVNEGVLAVEETKPKQAVVQIPRHDRPHKRKPLEIRRIVRIFPKRVASAKVKPLTAGGIVDWSHRWEVRGHWRKVQGVGKDRVGDYVVEGWTWVANYVKGPEDSPLVKKTRVLHTKEVAI